MVIRPVTSRIDLRPPESVLRRHVGEELRTGCDAAQEQTIAPASLPIEKVAFRVVDLVELHLVGNLGQPGGGSGRARANRTGPRGEISSCCSASDCSSAVGTLSRRLLMRQRLDLPGRFGHQVGPGAPATASATKL